MEVKGNYTLDIKVCDLQNAPIIRFAKAGMVDFVKLIRELIGEVNKIGPMGIAALALLVALSAIWVLGGKP